MNHDVFTAIIALGVLAPLFGCTTPPGSGAAPGSTAGSPPPSSTARATPRSPESGANLPAATTTYVPPQGVHVVATAAGGHAIAIHLAEGRIFATTNAFGADRACGPPELAELSADGGKHIPAWSHGAPQLGTTGPRAWREGKVLHTDGTTGWLETCDVVAGVGSTCAIWERHADGWRAENLAEGANVWGVHAHPGGGLVALLASDGSALRMLELGRSGRAATYRLQAAPGEHCRGLFGEVEHFSSLPTGEMLLVRYPCGDPDADPMAMRPIPSNPTLTAQYWDANGRAVVGVIPEADALRRKHDPDAVRSRHWVALDRPGHFTSRAESEKVRIEVAVRIIEGDALVVEHAGPARSPAASSEAHQLTERLAGVDIRRTLRIGDEVLIVGYAGSEPIVLSTKPHAHAVELPVAACKPAPRFPESGVSR